MLALDSAVPEVTTMLLFEFFPAFVALVSIVAGIWLFMQNLEADRDAEHSAPADVNATRPVESAR
jgi:hypothetical protein